MKKVAFYTLGCKLNYSETSTISRKFEEKGYLKVDFTDQPDIFIINTCSVTENADKKCRKIVREARAISPDGYIAIIGCYAQLKPKEISEIPGVDAVLGAAEKFRLVELLDGFERQPEPRILNRSTSSILPIRCTTGPGLSLKYRMDAIIPVRSAPSPWPGEAAEVIRSSILSAQSTK